MLCEESTRTRIKTAASEVVRGRRSAFAWSDVLRAMPRENVRLRVLDRYRAAGFTPDQFERLKAARAHLADCLTRAEDWLELDHPKLRTERAELARIRRPLEQEVR